MGPGPLAGGLNPPGTAIQPTMLSGEKLGGAVVSAATAGQSAATPAQRRPAATLSQENSAIGTFSPSWQRTTYSEEPSTSLTNEIVGADGPAQIGPALRAPVIAEAHLTHEGPDTLGLAHRSVRWVPQPSHFLAGQSAPFGDRFKTAQDAVWGTNVQIDPGQKCP